MSYFAELAIRLALGAEELPEALRDRHARYLRSMQAGDGGFTGREGPGDLYYTAFALRGLAMLGELDEDVAKRTVRFLTEQLDKQLPTIDLLSLLMSAVLLDAATGIDLFADLGRDRQRTLLEAVEPFRREDGGYAKSKRGGQSSTYHTFLIAGCKQMIDLPITDSESMAELIRSRQRDDGGFVELDAMRSGGTNPTAAAVGLLRLLDERDETAGSPATRFLLQMQNDEGGLRANGRIPVADLLSTFTGLIALDDLSALPAVDTRAMARFAESLAMPDGGFRAGTFDDAADVEYTFYGLGTLSLLSAPSE